MSAMSGSDSTISAGARHIITRSAPSAVKRAALQKALAAKARLHQNKIANSVKRAARRKELAAVNAARKAATLERARIFAAEQAEREKVEAAERAERLANIKISVAYGMDSAQHVISPIESKEVDEIRNEFAGTLPAHYITKIERIYNPYLEQKYEATRRRFIWKKKSIAEELMFHGTASQNIDKYPFPYEY
jgi:hypothetical protein